MCKNASGAVISMSVEVAANKAVLLMVLSVVVGVRKVIATTVKMNVWNSALFVMNIIVLTTTVTTTCIDHEEKYKPVCLLTSYNMCLLRYFFYPPNRETFRRSCEPAPSALQFQVRNNVFLLYSRDCASDTVQ
mmetsp:Transcript_27311/g.46411  ORF Transcript_27311/g.46411 Transcript_27311/m.46411 type:complete len:133 (-) Transcript_27311:76-474(-)